jgi:hypothetical protein
MALGVVDLQSVSRLLHELFRFQAIEREMKFPN